VHQTARAAVRAEAALAKATTRYQDARIALARAPYEAAARLQETYNRLMVELANAQAVITAIRASNGAVIDTYLDARQAQAAAEHTLRTVTPALRQAEAEVVAAGREAASATQNADRAVAVSNNAVARAKAAARNQSVHQTARAAVRAEAALAKATTR
jgi:hypothetical protein